MGGMHSWIWGVKYPDFMDALAPMASQPTAMASRNWMLRRMMLETIRNDPDYAGGNYTTQPRMMKYAINAFAIATTGGTLAMQTQAGTCGDRYAPCPDATTPAKVNMQIDWVRAYAYG